MTPASFAQACRALEDRACDNLHDTEWLSVEFRLHRDDHVLFRDYVSHGSGNGGDGGGQEKQSEEEAEGEGELIIKLRPQLPLPESIDGARRGFGQKEEEEEEIPNSDGDDTETTMWASPTSVNTGLVRTTQNPYMLDNDCEDMLEEDDVDDEEDHEALTKPCPDCHFIRTERLAVDFSIVLSPIYQVPVLWFSMPGSIPIRADDLDKVYSNLVTEDSRHTLRQLGVMGGISIANHPITNRASFFIHPCNTPEVLAAMKMDRLVLSPFEHLLLWFGMIGSLVGLHVPSKLVARTDVV